MPHTPHCRSAVARRAVGLSLAVLAPLLAGCAWQPAAAPHIRDGWMVYTGDATTVRGTCGVLPIELTGSNTRVRLDGTCHSVLVTGSHNDIYLGLAPGGRVEVTGAHNDIWWHQTGPGPRPTLLDRGGKNGFHEQGG
jgi:hypothetical protein